MNHFPHWTNLFCSFQSIGCYCEALPLSLNGETLGVPCVWETFITLWWWCLENSPVGIFIHINKGNPPHPHWQELCILWVHCSFLFYISSASCFHQSHCGGVGLSLVFGPTQPSKPGSSSPTQLNFTSVHLLKSQDYPLENKRQSGNKSWYWRKIPFVAMLKWFLEFEGGMVETFQLNGVRKCPASILKTCRWSWKGNQYFSSIMWPMNSSLPPPFFLLPADVSWSTGTIEQFCSTLLTCWIPSSRPWWSFQEL